MQKFIIINFSIPGLHKWGEAPGSYSYLREDHRHIFHWKIQFNVSELREIEFIHLKDSCVTMIEDYFLNEKYPTLLTHLYFGNMSCEEIAEATIELIKQNFPEHSVYSVEVYEDNENGAKIIL